MRINITGNAGSGKSTLARKVADELEFPLIEMDRILWKPGWRQSSPEECQAQLSPLLEAESWVFDGVSRLARKHADLIVFLDMPRHVCAWRCVKRNWRYLLWSRPGLPDRCPEWRIVLTLARIIKNFPVQVRPVIIKDIVELGVSAVIIKNSGDLFYLNRYISRLRTQQSPIRQENPFPNNKYGASRS